MAQLSKSCHQPKASSPTEAEIFRLFLQLRHGGSSAGVAHGRPRARVPDVVGSRLPSPYHFRARIQSFQALAAPFPGDSVLPRDERLAPHLPGVGGPRYAILRWQLTCSNPWSPAAADRDNRVVFAPDRRGRRGRDREAPAPQQILSRSTVSAVESAFNSLANTVLSNNARTLEDLVKEMLRPMLKSWLDDNLPGLVERIVKAEIERVSRGR